MRSPLVQPFFSDRVVRAARAVALPDRITDRLHRGVLAALCPDLLELPLAPLCNPDCAGLCATCGANHNLTRCECVTSEIDPRWAALRSLEL